MRLLDEIKPTLNSLQPSLNTINSAIDPGNRDIDLCKPQIKVPQSFLDVGETRFHTAHFTGYPIDLLIESAEKDDHDIVRFGYHDLYSAATMCAGSSTPASSISALCEYWSIRASIS